MSERIEHIVFRLKIKFSLSLTGHSRGSNRIGFSLSSCDLSRGQKVPLKQQVPVESANLD